MKKVIIIIFVLVLIFMGIMLSRTIFAKTNQINIKEVEEIESYINQIYLEKEILGESLPTFEEIEQANKKWILGVIQKNIEDEEPTKDKLQEKIKEVFGKDLTIENEQIEEIETDNQGSLFLLDKIEKVSEGYEVEIIEYLEDYSTMNTIVIKNLNEEEISRTSTSNETEAIEIVKRNKERFNKKKIWLKRENEKLYVQKIKET